MEKPDVLSLVVKETLFNKEHDDELLNAIERSLSPDYLWFGDNHAWLSEIRAATSLMQHDYKIYDELRQMKRDTKK
jgi:hypothetical protein